MERAYGFAIHVETFAPATSATVTVKNSGTVTISTIFSDDGVTPKANPFTADATTAYWFFYAASTVDYDVTISGVDGEGDPITSYTLGDISLGGVFSLNGLTTNPQVFAVGTAGNDFNIASAGSTHTFNIPDAGPVNRGLVTSLAQTFVGAKSFSTPIVPLSGGTGLAAVPSNGSLLIGRTSDNTFLLANLTATTNQTTVTNGAGSITIGTVQDIGTASSPVFTGLRVTGLGGPGMVGATSSGVLTVTGLTNGQVIVGSTGLAPVAATLTAGANVTITNAAGSITIASAGAIASLNGLTAATQTFVTGTDATAGGFSISSVISQHTFNLPYADTAVSGQVSTTSQTFNGTKTFNDPVLYLPGTATSGNATVSGVVYANNVAVVTTGAPEEDLMTYTMPANVLSAAGKGVRVTVWSFTDATNASKTTKVYFGATAVSVNTNNAANNIHFFIYHIHRITSTTQTGFAFKGSDTGIASAFRLDSVSPGETLTSAVTIKVTGTAAGGTITARGMIVEVVG